MIWILLALVVGIVIVAVSRSLLAKGAPPGSHGDMAPAPAVSGGGSKPIPAEWGWAKIHLKAANLKALGYYYRDRQAGPSFKIVVDLASPMDDESVRAAALAASYRGDSTFRLGAHETIRTEGMPADFAAFMRNKYETGDSPAGPQCAVVLNLTSDEQRNWGLPERPPWIDVYL